MLTIDGVSKRYGTTTAVQDISFSLEKGEVIGLLGVNGAGKTTIMNMISGFFPPSTGTIRLRDRDVSEQAIEYKKNIGYCPENPPLYLDMTIREQLRFVCSARRLPRSQWREEIERVARLSNIEDVAHRVIRTMSKGYKQRIGLAQALIGKPELLILDEPTAGLDPEQIIEIRELIDALRTDHTVIISSHILSEIASVSTRILILHNGRLVADEPVGELLLSSEKTPVLTVRVLGDPDEVRDLISGSIAIDNLNVRETVETNCYDYDIQFPATDDIRAKLSRLLVEHGFSIMGLHLKTRTLEDIFIELIKRG